ncbi:MAG: type II toxin-antitoxin system RelE/ParE family toxin [Leptolyngbyaceae cyanobacterium RU_5_1]|nr:type II toxin-antitoxin system RelE/ParE family toxin [Leptolyngbyaceae cyanobacterium RU_5_1]
MPHSRPLPIELSPEAQLDFIEILQFTEERFGFEQRDIYADWIDAALQRLAQNPALGKETHRSGYYRYHIAAVGKPGRHYLYYRVFSNALQIARIMHDRMDYLRHPPFNE